VKTVKARLDIQVYVNCPHCDNLINLLDENDTNGVAHNDCNDILKEACPDGNWSESHDKFELEDVTCSVCKGDFNVLQMEW
jgi:hypothetical protein